MSDEAHKREELIALWQERWGNACDRAETAEAEVRRLRAAVDAALGECDRLAALHPVNESEAEVQAVFASAIRRALAAVEQRSDQEVVTTGDQH